MTVPIQVLNKFPKLSNEKLMFNLSNPTGKNKLILDTDTANEIDDQFALAWALLSEDKISLIKENQTLIGILNPFNRKQESEADYLGMIFSSLSGYDIRETVKIWERMKEFNKGEEPPQFMSTHPSSDTRIKQLNEWMNEVILDYPPINLS